ncbi:helix-turn-helix domain-containing protein [Phaeocystidibacter luteus]|uniref:Transcription regulator BetR N-terminal domain-containing protein n=1 Tax=Phaeocystidibacter luteus TaxID=911197 RepID=A0A6N6RJH7_9FLAO|nr:hypothetical protein [Phaeocystidibacter luteus]KAB2814224.1 hypothetical protein F8C67_00405 [Phaeocystidibacter luteus]
MRKENSENIQDTFLSQIKAVLPSNVSLATELSDTLGISMDSAYRRVRGETPISLEESYILSEKYNVSLGGLTKEAIGMVSFGYTPITADIEGMERYFQRLLDNLRIISKIPGASIKYCSQDIPIFHNVRAGMLTKFKVFYWMRSIMGVGELMTQKLDEDVVPLHIIELCEKVYKEYCKVDCQELWSYSTINSTLRQVQYYWESGLFATPEVGFSIINDIRSLVKGIEDLAVRGYKDEQDKPGKYDLYISEIELTTNAATVDLIERKAVFLGHHTFNMLETTHEGYANQTDQWFKNMVGKATLISQMGEKSRFQFFQDAYRKIDALESQMSES